MKKKYLYNGQIMQEADVMDAAKQSNLDLDTYIQKAGIKPIEDTYSYEGKDFTAEDVLDAANQSKLGFDDYIQKAGFTEKKNGVGSNGSVQSTSQSVSQNGNGIGATGYPKSTGVLKNINDAANTSIDISKHVSKLPVGENRVGAKTQARYATLLPAIMSEYGDGEYPTAEQKVEWQELQNEIRRLISVDAPKTASNGLSKEPENHFAAIENVLVEKKNADEKLKAAQTIYPGYTPDAAGIEAQDKFIKESAFIKKQAEQSEGAVLKANKEKIWEPIAALTSNPDELKKFFIGDVFNHEYANQYFHDYVSQRGGGGYSRVLMVAKMKAAAEWEHDNPRRKKLLEAEYKSKGINIDKYGQQLYDKAVVPLVNRQEEMMVDAKEKADSYLEALKPKAAEIGNAYKQSYNSLQQLYQNGSIPKEDADKELANINAKYLKEVKGLDSEYFNQIKSINKSVANKFGRITKEIEVIGKTITDEKVWASIPEADKKDIALSQEAAQKKLEAEKNKTRKDIDKAVLGISPVMFVGKAVTSGWEQGMADMGDYLSFKGFDNKFVRDLQSRRTQAEELSPAEYTWQENPFMKAVTSAGVSMGASLPTTGTAIGVTALSGGLGLPVLVTTLAGGLTAWGLESVQNTGGAYRSILEQKQGDVSLAISGAREFNAKQDVLIPLYFVSSLGLQNIMKGGVKKTLTGTGMEIVEELPTEYFQGFTQAEALGYGGTFKQYIRENPTLSLDIIAGTLGQSTSMAAATKAYSTLFKKSPNPEEQFYADMIEKGGVEMAIKNIQQQVENDIITEDEYKIKYANIQSVLATLGKVEQLGLTGDDAKAFIAYSKDVKDLTRKIDKEQNEALKDIYTQKLKEAKNDLTEISQGKGVYAVVTMPGGANQSFVMPVEELDDKTILNAEKIEIKNDKLANKDIQKRKAELGTPSGMPNGFYQEKPLTAAEEKIKSGDMLGALTNEEKKEWNDLSMAEKLELAKENLPEVEGLSNVELMKEADVRAKELLDKLHGAPDQMELLNKKLTYDQKYMNVEWVDPISNETKTMSAESARRNIKKRYETLNSLIKCLT